MYVQLDKLTNFAITEIRPNRTETMAKVDRMIHENWNPEKLIQIQRVDQQHPMQKIWMKMNWRCYRKQEHA